MGSGNGVYSVGDFDLDAKWLIDPKHLLLVRGLGKAHMPKCMMRSRYKNQNVAVKNVHRGETPEQIAKREARFAREVAMMSKVQHKNLVKGLERVGCGQLC
ncbi:uncharacterized protein LOC126583477 [Malus sylvestris]|uniref:uncharacterized protein LOC126583477 n=1 Tax=Malus sylvestris TaxID=3752 RepID=UPI0021ACB7C3|nr:uncharacterized protein LOC126583477 [Malus sylvestris]